MKNKIGIAAAVIAGLLVGKLHGFGFWELKLMQALASAVAALVVYGIGYALTRGDQTT